MTAGPGPARVLVVLPSWVGDTVMATPTVRLLRTALGPGTVLVGLCRPGLDDLLAGLDLFDDCLVADGRSLMGPAKVASRLTAFRFDGALILPNSFSSAMTVRLAGIPHRVGYDRDGRGLLLTRRLEAPRRPSPHQGWEPISAVEYYLAAGRALLEELRPATARAGDAPGTRLAQAQAPAQAQAHGPPRLELAQSEAQRRAARTVLADAGVGEGEPFAIINPGGNNPAKRWPVERFAVIAHHLIARHQLRVLINGSPAERELAGLIKQAIVLDNPGDEPRVACLPELGITLSSLKGVVEACRLMVTNDTGPRHIAAAFDRPCVTLFGPTDPRWTTLPPRADGSRREIVLVADPTLPPDEFADDHPARCRIDRITTDQVRSAVDSMLG
jgi:heptosyltransferase-2